MNDLKPRQQPLLSEVYDLIKIPLTPTTSITNTTNRIQTYDDTKQCKKKNLIKKDSKYSNLIIHNTSANTKEEMIQDFFQSEKYHEHQKEFKLNQLKNQKRLTTNTTLQNIPEINSKSNSILANNQNYKPIYDRVDEITQKKQENIETLRSLYVTSLKEDQQITKAKEFTGYSKKTMKWVNKQGDLLKKKKNNTQAQLMDKTASQQQQLSKNNQVAVPTQSTKRLLVKDIHSDIAKSSLNFKRELMIKESNLSFTPILNRNRSEASKLYPNYVPINPKKRKTKSTCCNKKQITPTEALPAKKHDDKPKCQHWSSLLLNLEGKQITDDDNMYRINIYPSGAWNENSMNKVNMNSQTKKIISHLLS